MATVGTHVLWIMKPGVVVGRSCGGHEHICTTYQDGIVFVKSIVLYLLLVKLADEIVWVNRGAAMSYRDDAEICQNMSANLNIYICLGTYTRRKR